MPSTALDKYHSMGYKIGWQSRPGWNTIDGYPEVNIIYKNHIIGQIISNRSVESNFINLCNKHIAKIRLKKFSKITNLHNLN